MVRRMELELRKTVVEMADMKKALGKSSRKVESLEREVKQIRTLVEDIHSEQLQMGSRTVAESGEGPKPLASGDVDLRPQVRC